jgi:hypothetical protein
VRLWRHCRAGLVICPRVVVRTSYRVTFDFEEAHSWLSQVLATHWQPVALSNIASVNYQYLINHAAAARAEHLRAPVPFCAPLRLVPFTTSPVIDDLIAVELAPIGDWSRDQHQGCHGRRLADVAS